MSVEKKAMIAMAIIVIVTIQACISIVLSVIMVINRLLFSETGFPFRRYKIKVVNLFCQLFFKEKRHLSNFFTLLCQNILHFGLFASFSARKTEPEGAHASSGSNIKVMELLFYSSGIITTSILLPAAISWRAKAAIDSGVCPFRISS